MTEHPQLETPGGRIRAAREVRGLSLADLSDLTKIPPPVLMAIEADEYHKVSGALYIKSFLRSCASELGLDADEILDLYGQFSGEVRSGSGVANAVWDEEEVQISHVGLPWRAMAITGLALVLVGVGVLLLVRGCNEPRKPAASEEAEVSVPESLMASTESVTEKPKAEVATPRTSRHSAKTDTLAGAWGRQESPPPARTVAEQMPQPEVVSTGAPRTLPLPLVGGPNLVFAGGGKQAVVVRIISGQELTVEVKRDAEQAYTKVRWPAEAAGVEPLPPTGIVPGKVYAIGRGLVMYWGASDHISLRLNRTDGVELALNGKLRNIRNLRAGAELLLDLSGN